ncbi:hypothetical protein [Catalinimonas alkaloidigena]|nr:hypothetical protein [Catalinimonas alkaloidigena]
MKITWNVAHRILGIAILTVGIIILCAILYLSLRYDEHMEQFYAAKGMATLFSFSDFLRGARTELFIGTMLMAAGAFMLLKKQLGWILGYGGLLFATAMLARITFQSGRDVTLTFVEPAPLITPFSGIGLAVCFILILLLLSKPIRTMNKISTKPLLFSTGSILLLYVVLQFTHIF